MTPALARLAHPALGATLDLANRPASAATEARLRAAFADLARAHPPTSAADGYLGLAYPVACLADELLTAHPALGAHWTEAKLEAELTGTSDRAWQFWVQAELALARGPDDAELFLTCHGLGFRGEPPGGPTAAARWAHQARTTTLTALREPPSAPPALADGGTAPPLTGNLALRRAGIAAAVALALAVPVAALVLASGVPR